VVKLAKIEVTIGSLLIIAALWSWRENQLILQAEQRKKEEEYDKKMNLSRTNWHGDLEYGVNLLKKRQTIVPNFKNYKNIKYFKNIRPFYKELDHLG